MYGRLAILGFGLVIAVGCGESFTTGSPTAPTINHVSGGAVLASEPPYGEYMTVYHAGSPWTGTIPFNPCKNISAWSSHGHLSSTELYSEDDPWTPEDEGGVFGGWDCGGGQSHSNGSTVSILD